MRLMEMNIQAHLHANVKILSDGEKDGCRLIVFDNGDEIMIYDREAQIVPLMAHERDDFVVKVFVDYELPVGTERAFIEQLGLIDYMVYIGICKSKGDQ